MVLAGRVRAYTTGDFYDEDEFGAILFIFMLAVPNGI
jgi:hypothetical protein